MKLAPILETIKEKCNNILVVPERSYIYKLSSQEAMEALWKINTEDWSFIPNHNFNNWNWNDYIEEYHEYYNSDSSGNLNDIYNMYLEHDRDAYQEYYRFSYDPGSTKIYYR